ncbi:MAG: glucosaminidase domain-containing protein, partial [Thiotrichaceae bacterium]|nr:glucosaminidase domain-containing protein [Thiotrichaceae bacterium]
LGVTADVIVSQAALETGWGKHIISTDKISSFNMFNIKANREWNGERMEKTSIEFIQGKALRQKSDFRAYASLEQSFSDYVSFLKESPRYQSIFNAGQFNDTNGEQLFHEMPYQLKSTYIEKLQQAGYATDPAYAEKVLNVLKSDVIQAQVQNQTKIAAKWR